MTCWGCPKDADVGYKSCASCRERKRRNEQAKRAVWTPEQRSEIASKQRDKYTEAKQKCFAHYGNSRCACCNESNFKFLTIDHIEGGGQQHRKSQGYDSIHFWLIRHNFPVGYQVLCYNCNCGRGHNHGVCPHKEKEN